ncbi:SAP30 [Candida oxycetoniae]|uniref:SAP30 n=1 Tax=Candida oxycetoniae TaxID=497107 RepID=A0AAI9SSH9_9ASCO|nr:SAP30 [Candida oxycetoniae]KAI3402384.1 SAP30 [Candida oxycetoniae]
MILKPTAFLIALQTVIAVPLAYPQSFQFDLVLKDLYYIQDLYLGTPPQKLENTILDTGSTDLVLLTPYFKPNDSSTFHNTTNEFEGVYGTIAPFIMYQASDILSSPNGFLVNNETFGVSNISSNDFDGHYGICGVGFTATEFIQPEYKSFPYLLKEQGRIERVLFSIDGKPQNGSIIFGGIHSGIFQGSLTKVPMIERISSKTGQKAGYYLVPNFTVNEIKLGDIVISNENTLYTIDSGANVFAPPDPVLANLFVAIGADSFSDDDEGYTYFNVEQVNGKQLSFDVQGFELKFPLKDLIQDTREVNGTTYVGIPQFTVDIGVNADTGTLPNFLLQYYYTVWDYENHQMYFANYSSIDQGSKGKIGVASGTDLPVPTQNPPHPLATYSVVYNPSLETTLTASPTSDGYKNSSSVTGAEHTTSVTEAEHTTSVTEAEHTTSVTLSKTLTLTSIYWSASSSSSSATTRTSKPGKESQYVKPGKESQHEKPSFVISTVTEIVYACPTT